MSDEFPRSGQPEDTIDNPQFEDLIITEVKNREEDGMSWYTISCESSGFGMPKVDGVDPPEVGDRVRMWNYRGMMILGMALRGTVVYYRTEEENQARLEAEAQEKEAKDKAEWEATGQAELQARYEALPEAFQHRIDKYRRNNPRFGWRFEAYEMTCCEQAAIYAAMAEAQTRNIDEETDEKIAEHFKERAIERARELLKEQGKDMAEEAVSDLEAVMDQARKEAIPEEAEVRWLLWWKSLSGEESRALMPEYDDELSGNMFGCACNLAMLWLVHGEEAVVRQYGALAPLVGSDEYGDSPMPGSEAYADTEDFSEGDKVVKKDGSSGWGTVKKVFDDDGKVGVEWWPMRGIMPVETASLRLAREDELPDAR